MKGNKEFVEELERHFIKYQIVVNEASRKGYLKDNTVNTYLLHTGNFVKLINDEFEPGGRNK